MLLGRWKHINYAINRLYSVNRMQCTQYKMPCLRRCNRCAHGVHIAHLAYDQHVWVMTESMHQSSGEGFCIITEVSLCDETILVRV